MEVNKLCRCLLLGISMVSLAACEKPTAGGGGAAAPDSVAPTQAAPADQRPQAEQRAVVAETLAYAEVDKKLVKGHFAFPEDMVEPLPAVVVVHEWWGLNDHTRAIADRLAAEGFIVLAVDLFDGATASQAPDARELMLRVVEHPQHAESNIEQARQWLVDTTGAPSVAIVGYGFGGGWSLHTASIAPENLAATVIYYGQVSGDDRLLEPVAAPVLGFFGTADTAVPLDSVNGFEAALQRLGKNYRVERYEGASGGFADPASRNYDENLARSSWDQMIAFLHENLPIAGT